MDKNIESSNLGNTQSVVTGNEGHNIKEKNVIEDIIAELTQKKSLSKSNVELLRTQKKETLLDIYFKVYEDFISDRELTVEEIKTLRKFQETFGLSNEDIQFDDLIKPYLYIHAIRRDGCLPSVQLNVQGSSPVLLKQGELVHFADLAVAKERRGRKDKNVEKTQGVVFVVENLGVYKLGRHRGYVVDESCLTEISRGVLIITNQRIFLHPLLGYRPIHIPLNKILVYNCYENGVEIYKEGRNRGYFFSISKIGSIEIFGICLYHLINMAKSSNDLVEKSQT